MDLLLDQTKPETTDIEDQALTVVGIGASAGCLEALTSFFNHLPINTGFAFIVATHLCPDRPSLLPELLQKHTEGQIIVAKNNLTLKANQVFIC